MSKVKIQVNADLSVIESQLRKDEKFSQGIHTKDLEALYSSSRKSITGFTATIQKA